MLALTLPSDIERRLDELARKTGRSKTFLAREAIVEHLDDREDLYLSEQQITDLRAGLLKTIPLEEVMKRYGVATPSSTCWKSLATFAEDPYHLSPKTLDRQCPAGVPPVPRLRHAILDSPRNPAAIRYPTNRRDSPMPGPWKPLALAVLTLTTAAHAQLSPDLKTKIDTAVQQVLTTTGVPSAQVGIAEGGKLVYTAAFGKARLDPTLDAAAAMHYPVGSISKQFTAACILLLVQDGKMTLDDPVARWFPELTQAQDVTVRMLLSHTSGYSDYAPQDYTIPAWTKPIDPLVLIHEWAEKPLDFSPGTRWQYSNTNFVLAALIVQKASGMPFWQFLETRVLTPLALHGVLDLDTDRKRVEVQGYMRNALGPLRPAILEAPGWYFGDGELAMPVADLLRWDNSILDRALLKPESYAAMETEVKLKNGDGSHYGLGLQVGVMDGHRILFHSGEVGGFVAENLLLPDDKIAIAVLTNQEASDAAGAAVKAIIPLLLSQPPDNAADLAAAAQVKSILAALQQGQLDRSLLTSDCNFYFSPQTVADFESSLAPLGAVTEVKPAHESLRGGMSFHSFDVTFARKKVRVTTYTMPNGLLEQFLVETIG